LIKALIGWRNEAYFAFHYDDIMRANVVRQAWKITHPDNTLMRSFYDSCLWESIRLEGRPQANSVVSQFEFWAA
jgi:hypothetical protein